MPEGDVPAEWVEVNIESPPLEQRERLLLDVVDPLIHEVLSGRVADWHYFWEPALRLRIRWQQPTQADYTQLTDFLNTVKADGKLSDWELGSQGVVGQTYQGEAAKFGKDIWPYTYRYWTAGCELALALIKRDPNNALTENPEDNTTREFHWVYAVHLFSNPLGLGMRHLDEGRWSLRHAWNHLTLAFQFDEPHARDQQFIDVLNVITGVRALLDNTVRRLRSTPPSALTEHDTSNTA
jgi:hypothetical protein